MASLRMLVVLSVFNSLRFAGGLQARSAEVRHEATTIPNSHASSTLLALRLEMKLRDTIPVNNSLSQRPITARKPIVEEKTTFSRNAFQNPFCPRWSRYAMLTSFLVFFCMCGVCHNGSEEQLVAKTHTHKWSLQPHEVLWGNHNTASLVKACQGESVVELLASQPSVPIPTLWPKIISPYESTSLAVPAKDLKAAAWVVDVLGFMGAPVLSASQTACPDGRRHVDISTRGPKGYTLVSVTPDLEVTGTDGMLLGWLARSEDGRILFSNRSDHTDRPVMAVAQTQQDKRWELTSVPKAQAFGDALWRSASTIVPCEHLEVTAAAGVDAVFMLVCVLTAIALQEAPMTSVQNVALQSEETTAAA